MVHVEDFNMNYDIGNFKSHKSHLLPVRNPICYFTLKGILFFYNVVRKKILS